MKFSIPSDLKMQQTTNTVLMVRPASFRKNEQTAINNYFQEDLKESSTEKLLLKVQEEFDNFVALLKQNGIQVIVVQDRPTPDTPDAIFPNNWFSTHQNGTVVIYPMFAENRRAERNEKVLEAIEQEGFHIKEVLDYSEAETEEVFLEGTGAVILDRSNRKAYCALSARADESLFIEFCEDLDFHPVVFHAYQEYQQQQVPIYHTNVMMSIAETFAVICLSAITNKKERKEVVKQLSLSGKEIIEISPEQMHQFAGNMLQVRGQNNTLYLVMSSAAYTSLTNKQIQRLEKHCALIHVPLQTIETLGGGSARCMMAEVFLPLTK